MDNHYSNSEIKKTPKRWSDLYRIKFQSMEGFASEKSFNSDLMTASEFLEKAACSTVVKAENVTRRAAKQTLRKINKFLN